MIRDRESIIRELRRKLAPRLVRGVGTIGVSACRRLIDTSIALFTVSGRLLEAKLFLQPFGFAVDSLAGRFEGLFLGSLSLLHAFLGGLGIAKHSAQDRAVAYF